MSLSTVILNFFKSQCDFFFFLNRWICAVSVASHSHIWPSRLRKDARTKLRPQLSQVWLEAQSQSQPLCCLLLQPLPQNIHTCTRCPPLADSSPSFRGISDVIFFFLIRKIKRRAQTRICCEHRALCEVWRNDVKQCSVIKPHGLHPHCQPHPKHKHWCSCRHYAISKARGVTMEAASPRVLQPKLVAILDPKSFFSCVESNCRLEPKCPVQEFSVLREPNVRRCAAVGRARQVPGHVLSSEPRVQAEALPDLYVKHAPKKPKQSTAGGEQASPLQTAGCFGTWRVRLNVSDLIWGIMDVGWWRQGTTMTLYSLFNELQCITDETTSLWSHLQASCIQRSRARIWLFLFRDERTQVVRRLRDRQIKALLILLYDSECDWVNEIAVESDLRAQIQ